MTEYRIDSSRTYGGPLVSVIIIFLDAQRFIREAIESVFGQTYSNWELLLVDDGSTDAGADIALHYAGRYPQKVRYLEHLGHQNRGMSASRNLGIKHARGEYVGFLDADDVWLPHALEQQVAILDSYPEAGMVYGSTQYWYGWTGRLEDAQRDFYDLVNKRGVKPNTLLEPPMLLTVFLRDGGAVPCICSTLTRREVVGAVGGFEEQFRGQYEDQVFYFKVGLQAPVFVADACWSRYRQHPDSSWDIAQNTRQHLLARMLFLDWVREYLTRQGDGDAEVWGLLRREQRIVNMQVCAQKREWKPMIHSIAILLRHHPQVIAQRVLAKTFRRLASLARKLSNALTASAS